MNSLYALPSMLPSDFYIRFLVYDHYYVITAYILLYHLCYIPPVSCSYLIIPWVFPAWYQLLYIYLLLHAYAHDTIFNAYLWFRFIYTRVLIYARHLAFASPLFGEFYLTPLDPHVQVMELGTCGFPQLLIRVVQLKRGSPVDRPEAYPSRPLCVSLEFSFCKHMSAPCTVHTCIPFVFSHLRLSVM